MASRKHATDALPINKTFRRQARPPTPNELDLGDLMAAVVSAARQYDTTHTPYLHFKNLLQKQPFSSGKLFEAWYTRFRNYLRDLARTKSDGNTIHGARITWLRNNLTPFLQSAEQTLTEFPSATAEQVRQRQTFQEMTLALRALRVRVNRHVAGQILEWWQSFDNDQERRQSSGTTLSNATGPLHSNEHTRPIAGLIGHADSTVVSYRTRRTDEAARDVVQVGAQLYLSLREAAGLSVFESVQQRDAVNRVMRALGEVMLDVKLTRPIPLPAQGWLDHFRSQDTSAGLRSVPAAASHSQSVYQPVPQQVGPAAAQPPPPQVPSDPAGMGGGTLELMLTYGAQVGARFGPAVRARDYPAQQTQPWDYSDAGASFAPQSQVPSYSPAIHAPRPGYPTLPAHTYSSNIASGSGSGTPPQHPQQGTPGLDQASTLNLGRTIGGGFHH